MSEVNVRVYDIFSHGFMTVHMCYLIPSPSLNNNEAAWHHDSKAINYNSMKWLHQYKHTLHRFTQTFTLGYQYKTKHTSTHIIRHTVRVLFHHCWRVSSGSMRRINPCISTNSERKKRALKTQQHGWNPSLLAEKRRQTGGEETG